MNPANLIIADVDKAKVRAILHDLRMTGFGGSQEAMEPFLIRSVKTAFDITDDGMADIMLRGLLMQLDATTPVPVPAPAPAPSQDSTPTPAIPPSPASPGPSYGAACKAPGEDLTESDARMGHPIPVSFLSLTPDAILDPAWCSGYLHEEDGNITADPTMIGRSGKVYVFAFWRVAYSDAPKQYTNTVRTNDGGNVSRAYYECHNAG